MRRKGSFSSTSYLHDLNSKDLNFLHKRAEIFKLISDKQNQQQTNPFPKLFPTTSECK